ncbi:MAG: metal-dependent transcriptional regulator [Candidatus Omnitrophica bacterium]|jgi:DtxR family Mn-dependent transcriptional regulator|nr:metal-dependent transcriptional regulator [Candidatus Omnitrophota bacterium]
MDHNQKIEEALTIIWEEREKKIADKGAIAKRFLESINEDVSQNLLSEGFVLIEKDIIKFSDKGESKARDIIRRQRLAERLLMDVLEVGRKEVDSSACALEHILSKEVEESICSLLGHPKECPHGLSIPSGACCEKAKGLIESIVIPLTRLKVSETGKIVYVLTREHPQLHRLMSFGIVPGARIKLHQTRPSVIIQVEETQVALEEEIAKEIYVKRLS